MKFKKKHIKLLSVLTGVFAVIMLVFVILTPIAKSYEHLIDAFLNIDKSKIADSGDDSVDSQYFKSEYAYTAEGEEKLYNDYMEVYEQIAEEGTVLMQNKNDTLPITGNKSVVVYDLGSSKPRTGGAAGSIANELNSRDGITAFTSSKTTAENADYAIVEITRASGEGADPGWGTANGGDQNSSGNDDLALTATEKTLFTNLYNSSIKVIVLLNLSNQVDSAEITKADAVIWSSSVPRANIFVDLLLGKRNFSGRTVDTFYNDNTANPVMENFGYFMADLSNVSDGAYSAVINAVREHYNNNGDYWAYGYTYQEGIYVGYKYAETRYEDLVLGQGNANSTKGTLDNTAWSYSGYIAYPFGIGLDYTKWEYSNYSVKENGDNIDITVTVKNAGQMDGKHSVVIYMQSPYTEYDKTNGIEKSAVEVVGYGKTDVIKAGSSDSITVQIPKYMMRAYDSKTAKTYIEDAGTYYFTIGEDSHSAINNILAKKGHTPANTSNKMDAAGNADIVGTLGRTFNQDDFSKSYATGEKITNLYDDVDPTVWDDAKTLNGGLKYMSRSDWNGTYPTGYCVKYNDAMIEWAKPQNYVTDPNQTAVKMPVLGAKHNVVLADLIGKDYDDPMWDKLLEELTWEEIVGYINNGGFQTLSIPSIGKPFCTDSNGSSGRGVRLNNYDASAGNYPNTPMRTATYNLELNERAGQLASEAWMHNSKWGENVTLGLYGFSCNLHRSPYSGRNYEYYSEDSVVAGLACGYEAKGVSEKGGLTYIKHFFMNDCETMRHGVCTWANEQTVRMYSLPFEFASTIGHTKGYMNSFNRIGLKWVGQHTGAQISFLRDECGFHGAIVTDQFESSYQDSVDGIIGGTTLWLTNVNDEFDLASYKNDPVVVKAVIDVMHNNLFTVANSFAMNGITPNTKIVEVTSWWWSLLIAVDIIFAVLTVASAGFLVYGIISRKKQKNDKRERV